MADVFISYSNKDSHLANQVCSALEAAGLRCWIAPRDISKGTLWPEAITTALEQCPVVVLIFTANSNASPDVLNEIALATENNAARIVFQAEAVPPSKSLKYYLHVVQWLDATAPPIKPHLRELVEAVRQALAAQQTPAAGPQPQPVKTPAAAPQPGGNLQTQTPKVAQTPKVLETFGVWLAQYARGILTSLGMLALGGIILLVVMLARGSGTSAPPGPTATLKPVDQPTGTALPAEPTAPPTLAAATAFPTATAALPAKPAPPPCTAVNLGWGWASPIDGMGLMCVPEGEFLMGLPPGHPASRDDPADTPQIKVWLSAFWVDKIEVTNAMYAQFLNETGRVDIPVEGGAPWLEINQLDWRRIGKAGEGWRALPGFEDHPVILVSWYGAKAYCEWAGRRLLSEAQWEKAARGVDGRLYAWGNESPDCGLTNYNWCVRDSGTTPVNTHAGSSPFGMQDATGNVWEWVADWLDSEWYKNLAPDTRDPIGPQLGESKVFRGGSFMNGANEIMTSLRDREKPTFVDPSIGFRCGY